MNLSRCIDGLILSIVLILCTLVADHKDANPLSLSWLPHGERAQLGATYDTIARSIRNGRGFADPFFERTGPTAWMPPVLPYLLAAMYWVTGDQRPIVVECIVWIQFSVLLFSGMLVVGEARRLGVPWLGHVSWLLVLVSDYYEQFQRTSDIWLVHLILCILWIFAVRSELIWSTLRIRVLWGALGGFIALCAPIGAIVWSVVTFRTWRLNSKARIGPISFGHQAAAILVPLLISMVVAGPWCVRNRIVMGKWIPIKSNFAYELWQSQCLDDDGVLDSKSAWQHPWGGEGEQRRRYVKVGEVRFIEERWKPIVESIRSSPWNLLQRIVNRGLAATLIYHPIAPYLEMHHGFMVVKRWLFPLPFVGMILLLVLHRRSWTIQERAALAIYWLYVGPYILITYYDRYAAPLLSIKALIVLYALSLAIKQLPLVRAHRAENRLDRIGQSIE